MNRPPIILFSASPRRRELLERAGLPFRVEPTDTDESIPPGLAPGDVVQAIALRKLRVGLDRRTRENGVWGLAADTLVEGPHGLLGKPADAAEAFRMVESLSGKEHFVHSGIAVAAPSDTDNPEIRTDGHTTTVRFRTLSSGEISDYIATGEWEGAAGGYRIQQKGEFLVEEIRGLWSTVVGLPLPSLYGILCELSYPGLAPRDNRTAGVARRA